MLTSSLAKVADTTSSQWVFVLDKGLLMRDSIIFYKSFLQSVKLLPKEYQLEALLAILEYALEDKMPSDQQSLALIPFTVAKPQIDANNEKYENGKKGGRPKKDKTEKPLVIENKNHRLLEKETTSLTIEKPNYNVNVNANENENVNNDDKDTKNTSGIVGTKSNKKFIAPSIDEVRAYAVERGREDLVELFYKYYSASEWKDKSGKKVKNLKLKFVTWENNNPKPQSTTPFARQSQPQVDGSLYKVL